MTDTTKTTARERHCCVCGESLGVIEARNYQRDDTCGKLECDRAMRDMHAAEREEAHERLDRDMGW